MKIREKLLSNQKFGEKFWSQKVIRSRNKVEYMEGKFVKNRTMEVLIAKKLRFKTMSEHYLLSRFDYQ